MSWTCAAVLAIALVSGPARADALDDRAQAVIDALRKGQVDAAVAVLEDPDVRASLAGRPALVHVVCDRAYRFEEACRAAPEASRAMLATVLHEVATEAHEGNPDDARAAWALAHAIVVRERSGLATGGPGWLLAADLLEEAHAASPGAGEALGYAVTFLLEGAAQPSDARRDLLKRASGVTASIRKAHPESETLACTVATALLWAADSFLAGDRRGARDAVSDAFACLRPFVGGASPAIEPATLWNEGVALDTRQRLSLREKPVTRVAYALGGALRFELPVSSRWTVTEVPETEDADAYEYVTQTAADGTVLRQILFRSYDWGVPYLFDGPNEVNGDNVKSVARGLQVISAQRVFAPGAKLGAQRKGKFGDGYSGYVFDIRGTSKGDAPRDLRLVGHVGRTGRQTTHGILVYVYGDDGELDAATEAVLASMAEPES